VARKRAPQKNRRKKSPERDETDELMLAFLRNKGFEHTREYVQRGRNLKEVPSRELKERWVAAFKQMVATLGRNEPPIRMDIESELSIRGEDPPFDEVKSEFEALQGAVAQATDELRANPEGFKTANDEIAAEVEEFARSSKSRSS
jgi:hypothetical protein